VFFLLLATEEGKMKKKRNDLQKKTSYDNRKRGNQMPIG
jgi:hypothetical protein